jgi:hypothetical protein
MRLSNGWRTLFFAILLVTVVFLLYYLLMRSVRCVARRLQVPGMVDLSVTLTWAYLCY